jgi:hypothetical protein
MSGASDASDELEVYHRAYGCRGQDIIEHMPRLIKHETGLLATPWNDCKQRRKLRNYSRKSTLIILRAAGIAQPAHGNALSRPISFVISRETKII